MNLILLLYLLIIAPKILWDRIIRGKRHPGFFQRLGFFLPKPTGPVLWIHAVSVGEVKAIQPLFQELRKNRGFILVTTTSATGQAEAKRSLSEADAFAYLPLDFSWVVQRWVKWFNPQLFLLVESDFWMQLLSALKKNKTPILLVSGKMSARSARRFQYISSFAKTLFSHFDHLCVQNEEHAARFAPFLSDLTRLHITGNLKLDLQPQPTEPLSISQPTITLSCTHAPEEELLLDALQGAPYFLILAPRHPERFEEVAQLLRRKNIEFSRWSEADRKGNVLLVDAMGRLSHCYAHSRLAIVAGSYIPHIGGHNVLEPCLYGTPVFFGPHTSGQTEFANRALSSGAGLCVPLAQLRETIDQFFSQPTQEKAMRDAAKTVLEKSRGATSRTLEIIRLQKTFWK